MVSLLKPPFFIVGNNPAQFDSAQPTFWDNWISDSIFNCHIGSHHIICSRLDSWYSAPGPIWDAPCGSWPSDHIHNANNWQLHQCIGLHPGPLLHHLSEPHSQCPSPLPNHLSEPHSWHPATPVPVLQSTSISAASNSIPDMVSPPPLYTCVSKF
jgi:hypothetical protein